jgi:hypothetical protein
MLVLKLLGDEGGDDLPETMEEPRRREELAAGVDVTVDSLSSSGRQYPSISARSLKCRSRSFSDEFFPSGENHVWRD